MQHSAIPSNSLAWLHYRGLTDRIIEEAGISWDGHRRAIVIPIYDKNGTFLFNKYRREPGSEKLPKYWQDDGAEATLYGWHWLTKADPVIVCEGELDALLLRTNNYQAVSSTAGCGTFRQEWADALMKRQVYIIYDLDDPGLAGAQKAALMFAQNVARVVLLPVVVGNHGDITDFWQQVSDPVDKFKKLLNEESIYFSDYAKYDEPKTQAQAKASIKKIQLQLIGLKELEQEVSQRRRKRVEFNVIRAHYLEQKRQFSRLGSKRESLALTNDIEKAKAYPIERLYDGALKNETGYRLRGLCPFHEERTPSFVIYTKQNSWFCYGGCSVGGDSISYYQAKHDCDFLTAVKQLAQL